VIGALACSTAAPRVAFVAGPPFVLASYTVRTGSVYVICIVTPLLSRVEVKDAAKIVGFIVAWPCLASFGSFRWGVDPTSGTAMTSVGRAGKIVSTRCVVVRAPSLRKAGRLSWRRRVSYHEAYQLRLRNALDNTPVLSLVPLFAVQYDTNAFCHPPHDSVLVDGVGQTRRRTAF